MLHVLYCCRGETPKGEFPVLTVNVLEKIAESLHDLPAMPRIVQDVLTAAEDPAADMAHITALIERDPALTVRILRISNSPYYGMKQQVGTLRLALVILGVREVRNIVIGVAALDAVCGADTPPQRVEALWRHSVAVGAFAKKLGAALGYRHQGEDFIAGLLHDIGKVVMWRQYGRAYANLPETRELGPQTLSEREQAEFGFDHADVAAALVTKWNLPLTLADAVGCHHARPDRPFTTAKDPALAALVWVANRCVNEAGSIGASAAAQDLLAWAVLDRAPRPLCQGERRDTLAGIAEDMKLSSPLELQYQ